MDHDGLMLFDGYCHVCSRSVQTVLRVDREGLIRFAPVQSPLGKTLMSRHGLNPDDPASFIFLDKGRALLRSSAVVAIARRLPWPWRALAAFGILPRPLRDALYDALAKNRYRWFGRRETCLIPTDDLKRRFVE